jgi:hypothetical protein
VICTSCQSGLKPSPWIASSTLFPPPANGDLEARRADFIRILEVGFVPDPKPGPKLRSV